MNESMKVWEREEFPSYQVSRNLPNPSYLEASIFSWGFENKRGVKDIQDEGKEWAKAQDYKITWFNSVLFLFLLFDITLFLICAVNRIATNNTWLFNFKLIKAYNLKFSSLVTLATFQEPQCLPLNTWVHFPNYKDHSLLFTLNYTLSFAGQFRIGFWC